MQKDKTRSIDVTSSNISIAENLHKDVGTASLQAPNYNLGNTGEHTKAKAGTEKENEKEKSTGETLTFYCHGFIPDRDAFGNKNRSENGERLEDEDYNEYWKQIDDKFEERFTGMAPVSANTYYMDGSAGALSSAEDRYRYGLAAAQLVYQRYKANELSVVQDDNGCITNTINIVGHSMGGAYAAGLARGLLNINEKQGKKVFDVRAVYYLAPHQPMHFTHPSEIRGVQYSHEEDRVSSKGFIPWGSGSKLGPINGISEYKVHDVPGYNTDMFGDNSQRGGHNVDLHEYIFDDGMYERGQEGHVSANSDSDYDNYKDEGPSPEKPKDRFFQLPKILDFPRTASEWTGKKLRQLGRGVKKLGRKAKKTLKKWGRSIKKGAKSVWNKIKSWF